ncbi:hypothetical protein N7G274_003184 [Stereocaulon virgatum]|uniref:Uncharacterized protein n=1 Tax=Stereocaulon virgatum TaxID=373712 RepID=A0ABR4AIE5_9LECA
MGVFVLFLYLLVAFGASLSVNSSRSGLDLTSIPLPNTSAPTLPLTTLPNPYIVPGTSIALYFRGEPQPPLPAINVRYCLRYAGEQIITYLQVHPNDYNRPIPGGYYEARWDRVIFVAVSYNGHLTYNLTLEALYGLALKTNTDGSTRLVADVLLGGPGGTRLGLTVLQSTQSAFAGSDLAAKAGS